MWIVDCADFAVEMAGCCYELQVCAEFQRLCNLNIVDALQELLDKQASTLVQLVDGSPKLPIPLSDTLNALDTARNAEQKRGNWHRICNMNIVSP